MTCHVHSLARVCARVTQGLVQGFHRSFLRCCKGCKGFVHPCLTYMCARARLRMRVRLHKTLATLATLAHSKPISFFYSHLAVRGCARVTQGLGVSCKGLVLPRASTSPFLLCVDGPGRCNRRSSVDARAIGSGRGTPPGGVNSGGGGHGLDRIRSHVGVFFSPGGFSGADDAETAPLGVTGGSGASNGPLARGRSLRAFSAPSCGPATPLPGVGIRALVPTNKFPHVGFGL